MARDATIRTVLTASDQASGPLRNFQNSLRGVQSEMGGMNSMAGVLAGGIAGLAAAGGVDALLGMVQGAAQGAMELGRAAESFGLLRNSFDDLASGVGQSSDVMLEAMRGASGGMIADQELILAANRAMMLGIADSSAEMGQLLEVAAVRGRAMGLTTAQAFNDLVTGLGRMSPLILDNLGIVTGGEKVFEDYAKSIGTTADALSDAERKQALLNKVISETDTSGEVMVSQFERMDAALQNAKIAMGELFGPAVAAIAQDIANAATAAADALKVDNTEKAQNWIAANYARFEAIASELQNLQALSELAQFNGDTQQFAELQQEITNTTTGLVNLGIRYNEAAAILGRQLIDIDGLRQGEIGFMDAAKAAEYLKGKTSETAAAEDQAAGSGQMLASAMAYLAQTSYSTAGAVSSAQSAVSSIIGTLATAAAAGYDMANAMALVNQFKGLDMEAQKIREGLSSLSFYEPEEIDLIIQVNNQKAINEVNELIGAFTSVENTIKSISSLTPGLVENMGLDQALAWQAEQEASLRAQADLLRDQGYSDEQITVALRANVMETQNWASGLDKVNSATDDIEKSMSSLQGKVLGAVQSATQGDIGGVDPADYLPREDEVNENARRLSAIMRDGLTNQPWLEEFKAEVPGVFNELITSGDIQGTAAKILQDFQMGLRPELLDLSKLKEDIKNQIAGETAMQATAAQITAELVADTGGDSADIQAKVNKALGLGVKSTEITDGILGELNSATFNANLNTAAGAGGKSWGNAFLATVEANVPPQLIALLVNLVTPGVQGNLAQQGSLTGPTE